MAYKTTGQLSRQLKQWLTSSEPKTVAGLTRVFAEKSIGIIVLVLMLLPAMPLPTGGISHIFEIISMLVALQLMIGRRTFWIPVTWANKEIHVPQQNSAVVRAIRVLSWLESHSRPRLGSLMRSRIGRFLIGAFIFLYSFVAFAAPPFSGLDTFPSIGVVIIALSLILDDAAMLIVGVVTGAIGTAIVIGLGTVVVQVFNSIF